MTHESRLVGLIMGSRSDWPVMEHAAMVLEDFGFTVEARALSAHRTPDAVRGWVCDVVDRGAVAIIAGAGGAAALPGVVAAHTQIPVLGVPVKAWSLDGLDSLLSIAQMPGGIPVATFSIGKAGAKNAALFVVAMVATTDEAMAKALREYRESQSAEITAAPDPRT